MAREDLSPATRLRSSNHLAAKLVPSSLWWRRQIKATSKRAVVSVKGPPQPAAPLDELGSGLQATCRALASCPSRGAGDGLHHTLEPKQHAHHTDEVASCHGARLELPRAPWLLGVCTYTDGLRLHSWTAPEHVQGPVLATKKPCTLKPYS